MMIIILFVYVACLRSLWWGARQGAKSGSAARGDSTDQTRPDHTVRYGTVRYGTKSESEVGTVRHRARIPETINQIDDETYF
jgi:hypothetical protein